MSPSQPAAGAVRGGAMLRPAITAAIRDAVVDELAAEGYDGMSMSRVAERAGIGKAAIYRRWPSKQDMVVDLIRPLATANVPTASHGSLRQDLRAVLGDLHAAGQDPRVRRIVADLGSEVARNTPLGHALRVAVTEPRRQAAGRLLAAAQDRGELPAGLDAELALDFMAGPIAVHYLILGGSAGPLDLDRLVDMTLAALTAGA